MKLCMIGVRGHNNYVLDGLKNLKDVEVTGLSAGADQDDISQLHNWCVKHNHHTKIYDDYRKMIEQLKPDIISVAGPFELNAQICIFALQHGIPVFCEKPVATTLSDLECLKEVYKKTQVFFTGMMGLRYDPAFYQAWLAVQDGAVGTIRLINTQKSYKLGNRPSYFHSRKHGGTIPWIGSHAIDWIHWFSGERFCSVYASHSPEHNRGNGDLEITAMCQFKLSNDIFASASIDYLRPENAPTHGDDRIRIVGTEGILEVTAGKASLINNKTKEIEYLPNECDRHVFCDFVDHIQGKRQSLVTPQETLITTEACLLARESADNGQVIFF